MILAKTERIGRPNDLEFVFGLLSDTERIVRVNALQTISQLGNETNVRQIQEFIDKHKAHPEEVIEQLKHKRK
jgi:HEAT repeat protein